MLRYLLLSAILSSSVYCSTIPENKETSQENEQKPVTPAENAQAKLVPKPKELVLPVQQDIINQYFARQFSPATPPGGQYGLGFLEPQFQFPGSFPRVQPQIILYGPGGQGQPILINAGSPPGNFLVPRDDPNVISDNNPQRPVFIAGYPKPAHIPPIEKDAEEIPTNPKKIPPLGEANPTASRPQKLEAVNNHDTSESQNPNNVAPEVYAGQNPKLHPSPLTAGQPFFILNGDQVLPGFAELRPFTEDFYQRYSVQPFPNFLQSNEQFFKKQENINAAQPGFVQNGGSPQPNSEEKVSDNTFVSKTGELFKNGPVLPEQIGQFRFSPAFRGNIISPYQDDPSNEAIIVDANNLDEPRNVKGAKGENADSEVVTTSSTHTDPPGPSMAQAGPGAISLAGPGGVAGSAPRATAIVGKNGLAIANPQATAVAGPKENDKSDKKDSKNTESA